MRHRFQSCALTGCFFSLFFQPSAWAANAVLEEIVVTAQKRAQPAQDVPIAITALSGDFLEEKSILSAKDLENFTPGLRIPQQDSTKTFVRIRGVGSRKFDVGAEGSVGVFVDEVYIPRFSGADLGLLDLQRVEVLKGPQGTLLGRNTAAGAISVLTRRPTQGEPEGFLEAGASNNDSHLVRGAVSGAISDALSMRLAFGQSEEGGFQKNTLTGATDDRESSIVRLQAQYEPSDSLSILGTLQYTQREQAALLQRSLPTGPGGSITPLFRSPILSASTNDDLRDYPVSFDGDADFDSLFASLRVEKEFSQFSLVSITGFQDGDGIVNADFDGSELQIGRTRFEEESDTFSQEFRLVGDNWLAGIYYYVDDAQSSYEFFWGPDSLQNFLTGGALPAINDNAPIDVETTSIAVFGEYTIDLAERWSLVLGARYSKDEKDFVLAGTTTVPGLPAVVAPYVYADDESWSSVDPKVALNFQVSNDALIYFTFSEGYKSGGVQFTAVNALLARQTFDPEELTAYEVGFKSDLLENTLRVNGSVFYYDYQDLQVQRVDLTLSGGVPAAFTSNAAESDIRGFELDVTWLLGSGFDVRLAYAYLDAEYKDYIGPGGQDFSGNPLPASPKNTIIFSAGYETLLPGSWGLRIATDWIWVDDYNFDVADTDPFTKQDSYTVGGMQLSLTSPDEKWFVTAFAQNLNDEEFFSQKTRRGPEVIASAGNGRRYGVRFRYQF